VAKKATASAGPFAGPANATPQAPKRLHVKTTASQLELSGLLSEHETSHLHRLTWLADPKSGTPEHERIAALKAALDVLRRQVGEFRDGQRKLINPVLTQQIGVWGLQIFAAADPLEAMARFLGRKQPRGKRAKNTDRDLQIAVEVARKNMLEHMPLTKAIVAVGKSRHRSPERIDRIYKVHRKAARAEVALSLERKAAPERTEN
jgi:hypothetical protein